MGRLKLGRRTEATEPGEHGTCSMFLTLIRLTGNSYICIPPSW